MPDLLSSRRDRFAEGLLRSQTMNFRFCSVVCAERPKRRAESPIYHELF